jgi:hypothetical protein
MAPSRLERFKAAVKDDLDKLPDKPKVALPDPPPLESRGNNTTEGSKRPTGPDTKSPPVAQEDFAVRSNNEQITPPNTALERLTIIDDGALNSDDSEAGCQIEIEPVTEDEERGHGEAKSAKPASELGPRLRRGQVTIHGEAFCPILPVAKYPYKYVPRAESQAVASAFFDNGQFWQREWDL